MRLGLRQAVRVAPTQSLRTLTTGFGAVKCIKPVFNQTRCYTQVTVDRELPDVMKAKRQNLKYFGIFCGTMAVTLYAIIKYEDANSPVVSSTLLALRQSPLTRASLGDNIRYKTTVPWISGSSGIAGSEVDFRYSVVGDSGSGVAHFRAERRKGEQYFVVTDWSITPNQGEHQGETISLQNEELVPSL